MNAGTERDPGSDQGDRGGQDGLVGRRLTTSGVLVLTLRRPDVLNALNRAMLRELRACLADVGDARAVLLQGEGKVFSAGADLTEVETMAEREEFLAYVDLINDAVNDLERLELPVVGALHGGAYGGGLELLLGADIILAAQDTPLGLTEVRWATIPGSGGTQRLGRAIGHRRARALLLQGTPFTAEQAHEWGLVWEVVAADRLHDRAFEVAEKLARGPRQATACLKSLALTAESAPLVEGLAAERRVSHQLFDTADRAEGMRAFQERRTPDYGAVAVGS